MLQLRTRKNYWNIFIASWRRQQLCLRQLRPRHLALKSRTRTCSCSRIWRSPILSLQQQPTTTQTTGTSESKSKSLAQCSRLLSPIVNYKIIFYFVVIPVHASYYLSIFKCFCFFVPCCIPSLPNINAHPSLQDKHILTKHNFCLNFCQTAQRMNMLTLSCFILGDPGAILKTRPWFIR